MAHKCIDCGYEPVAYSAVQCPHCGSRHHQITFTDVKNALILLFVVIIVISAFISQLSSHFSSGLRQRGYILVSCAAIEIHKLQPFCLQWPLLYCVYLQGAQLFLIFVKLAYPLIRIALLHQVLLDRVGALGPLTYTLLSSNLTLFIFYSIIAVWMKAAKDQINYAGPVWSFRAKLAWT